MATGDGRWQFATRAGRRWTSRAGTCLDLPKEFDAVMVTFVFPSVAGMGEPEMVA